MSDYKYCSMGFYPFGFDNDYERCLISNCVSINTYEYNALPHSLHASDNLTIMHLNCCSLKSKYDLLQIFLSELCNTPDVLCLTESWTSKHDVSIPLQNYNMHNFPRNGRGGGIVIYVKSSLMVTCQVINIQV